MELVLERKWKKKGYTIGVLSYKGDRMCDTLEPQWRDYKNGEEKIKYVSAIPEGRYQIRFAWSNKKKKLMPYLLHVPMFEGIMIHTGNTARDTAGCILVGENTQVGKVLNSTSTFQKIRQLLWSKRKEGLYITIK